MNRRRTLIAIVSLLSIVGIVAFIIPFGTSMKLSARTNAALPRIDISKIQKGEAIILPHPYFKKDFTGYEWSVLIYRKYEGKILVWDIPSKGSIIGLPDFQWYRPSFPCRNFGPSKVNGKIDESLPIKCHDIKTEDHWYPELEWNIEGKVIKGSATDMNPTKGVVEGNYFVFGKAS